ncbi:MAG: type II CRISPR RNA-guided endonuclease Cas9 [Vampirovibrionales bacterium]
MSSQVLHPMAQCVQPSSSDVQGGKQYVFAYNLGLESLGYCVREANPEVVKPEAIGVRLVPATHASLTERGLPERRRAIRTRLAHKARETYFRHMWEEVYGLESLPAGDPRWQWQTTKKGKLCNSVGLRVAILEDIKNPDGTALEDWQYFKAFHHAIQRRGYGIVPWQAKEVKTKTKEGEDKEATELLETWKQKIQTHPRCQDMPEQYSFPCYFEATIGELWHYTQPKQLASRIAGTADKVRIEKCSVPREPVTQELIALFECLQHAHPDKQALQQTGAVEQFLYGRSGLPCASYEAMRKGASAQLKSYAKFRGSNRVYKITHPDTGKKEPFTIQGKPFPFEWEGVLSQKSPRFDNRIIAKCCLIPRLNVARAKRDNERFKPDGIKWSIVNDAKALMMLKNLRFTDRNNVTRCLTPKELHTVWEVFLKDKQDSLSASWLNKKLPDLANAVKYSTTAQAKKSYYQFDDWKPSVEGRSSLSRPAAYLLKELILSGNRPCDFIQGFLDAGHYPTLCKNTGDVLYPQLCQQKGKTGLTASDLIDFAKGVGWDTSWETLHLGDRRDKFLNEPLEVREKAIQHIIATCRNNLVRNRLQLFFNFFKQQVRQYGVPAYVVLEFIRDENSLQNRKAIEKAQKYLEKKNEGYKKTLIDSFHVQEHSITGKMMLKMALWEEQKYICPYTGAPIDNPLDARWDVDHIVPVSISGTSNRENLVLASATFNRQEKINSTPYEFFSKQGKQALETYQGRIMSMDKLPKKKRDLLTSENAREQVMSSYQGLAATSYISRLVQQVVHLYCNKGMGTEDQERFVFVANGKQTNRMAKALNAYYYLYDDKVQWEVLATHPNGETKYQYAVKNRANKRHHGVDAYLLSFFREFFKPEYDEYLKVTVPNVFQKGFIDTKLRNAIQPVTKSIVPINIKRNKIDLDLKDTAYGIRVEQVKTKYGSEEHYHLVGRSRITRKDIASMRDKALADTLTQLPDTAWQTVKEMGSSSVILQDHITVKHPHFKTPITKTSKVTYHLTDKPYTEVSRTQNARYQIANYGDVTHANTKTTLQGLRGLTFKCSKSAIGQVVYKEGKSWKVQPLYTHVNRHELLNKLSHEGYPLYTSPSGEPIVFSTGCMIMTTQPHPKLEAKGIYPYQPYEVSSVKLNGQVDLKVIESKPSINYFIEAGLQLYSPEVIPAMV